MRSRLLVLLAGLLFGLCPPLPQARASQVLSDSCAAFLARSYHSQGSFGRWLTTYLSEKYGDTRAEASFAWIAEHCQRSPDAKVGKVLTDYIETFHGGAPRLTGAPTLPATTVQIHTAGVLPSLWSFLRFLLILYGLQLFFALCIHFIVLKPLLRLQR